MVYSLQGIGASDGFVIGYCVLYDPAPLTIPTHFITPREIASERARLDAAMHTSRREIEQLRDQIAIHFGKEEAAIFDAHLLILEDEALLDGTFQRLENELMNVERALWESATEFAQMLEQLGDSYFQARAADINDVSTRVVSHLQNKKLTHLQHLSEPAIIVASDLRPSDTAGLNPASVLGIVTEQGGPNTHTAILSRQLGIPAVVAVTGLLSTLRSANDDKVTLVFNGKTGEVIIAPDEETLSSYRSAAKKHQQVQEQLKQMQTLAAVTSDGTHVEIAANIGRVQDALIAVEGGANGVGLFRTEFLFLDRSTPPDEEEQVAAYSEVLEAFAEKTVIVRTLDIGGDKIIPYMKLPVEDNPFLGLRGIRLCLAKEHQPLFRTQLRALLRAAEQTKNKQAALWIMFPMIDDARELKQAKAFLAETEQMLLREGVLQASILPHIKVGIMVETPAAALLLDVLSKDADFFSIGTNDLAQYTLASDRMNASLTELHQPFHPAVMRSVAHVITTARQQNRWVGMCGEMAGDPRASVFLLGLGINELSMNASSFNRVKQVIRDTSMSNAKALVQQVLQAESAEEIEALLSNAK